MFVTRSFLLIKVKRSSKEFSPLCDMDIECWFFSVFFLASALFLSHYYIMLWQADYVSGKLTIYKRQKEHF